MSEDTKKLIKSAVISAIAAGLGTALQGWATGHPDLAPAATAAAAWVVNLLKVKLGL